MNSFGEKWKIALLSAFVLLLLTGHAWAMSLSFSPASSDIYLGDSVNIDIIVSGLEADNLSSFSFTLGFDSAVLSFNSYILGADLGDSTTGEAIDNSSGANLEEISFLTDFSSQPDSFTLASVTFTGISVGSSDLGISNLYLNGSVADSVTSGAIHVTQAPVPEPATFILLGSGLAGLAFWRRRK